VADGFELAKSKGNVMGKMPTLHKPGQKARAASANVACIGRLNRRLRIVCTSRTTSDSGARSCPAVIRATHPMTAAKPPER